MFETYEDKLLFVNAKHNLDSVYMEVYTSDNNTDENNIWVMPSWKIATTPLTEKRNTNYPEYLQFLLASGQVLCKFAKLSNKLTQLQVSKGNIFSPKKIGLLSGTS